MFSLFFPQLGHLVSDAMTLPLDALLFSFVLLDLVDDDALSFAEVACVSAAPPPADNACDLDA